MPTRAESFASEKCEQATDEYAVLATAANICAEVESCTLTYEQLKAMGRAYYKADRICGRGQLANAPE